MEKFEQGPELPDPLIGHCLARLNETHIFIAGGNSSDVYLFDEMTKNFTALNTPLNQQRWYAACGVVKHSNKTQLMIVGGTCTGVHGDLCPWESEFLEVYDNGHFGQWYLGWNKTLGGGWGHGSYVHDYDGSPLILVGSDPNQNDMFTARNLIDDLIVYNNEADSFEDAPLRLNHGRSRSTSIAVPKGSIICE